MGPAGLGHAGAITRPLFGDRITSQVGVGFGKLNQLGAEIDISGNSEAALPGLDIGFDIGGSLNLGQIASDRRGTTASRHVGDVERDQHQLRGISRRGSISCLRGLRSLRGRATGRRSLGGRTPTGIAPDQGAREADRNQPSSQIFHGTILQNWIETDTEDQAVPRVWAPAPSEVRTRSIPLMSTQCHELSRETPRKTALGTGQSGPPPAETVSSRHGRYQQQRRRWLQHRRRLNRPIGHRIVSPTSDLTTNQSRAGI